MPDTLVHSTPLSPTGSGGYSMIPPQHPQPTTTTPSHHVLSSGMATGSAGEDVQALLDSASSMVLPFIAKISQTVLRARVGHPSSNSPLSTSSLSSNVINNHNNNSNLKSIKPQPPVLITPSLSPSWMNVEDWIGRDDFWRNGVPMNLDIFFRDRKTLLERWVLSYEPPSLATQHPSTPHHKYHSHKDLTDFILLAQSLYSYIRLMPLHTSLTDGSISHSDLKYCISTADGYPLSPLLDEDEPLSPSNSPSISLLGSPIPTTPSTSAVGSTGFDLGAKLKVYKFKTAHGKPGGKLHVSVVYDSNIAGLVSLKPDAKVVNPDQKQRRRRSGSAASVGKEGGVEEKGRGVHLVHDPEEERESRRPSKDSSAEDPWTKKSNGHARGGSPLPSPSMQRRVLRMTQGKYLESTAVGGLKERTLSKLSVEVDNEEEDGKPLLPRSPPVPIRTGLRDSLSDGVGMERSTRMNLDFMHDAREPPSTVSFSSLGNQSLKPPPLPQLPHHPRIVSPTSPNSSTPHHIRPHHHRTDSELFGSLVGSYENSILTGRMSTLPSKPIPFQAEIGVIGLGKCQPKLKCPSHLHLEFSSYFYDLQEDEGKGTPYVGCIDVEGLGGLVMEASQNKEADEKRFREKWVGGYRLPPKGQLQIVIKNPSRTAVKVFLIPYDFRDMPPNTKTFLRQKIYSTTASSPSTTSSRTTQRNRMSLTGSSPLRTSPLSQPAERLRDAIHVQFHCTDKKKLYLTKSIRVVYSQRAPDKEDKMRVVCEGPGEVRYIPCKGEGMPKLEKNSLQRSVHEVVSGLSVSSVESSLGLPPTSINLATASHHPLQNGSRSPTRRRSSFGMNMMAHAGVSMSDYSVSPVKHPMWIQSASPSSRFNFSYAPLHPGVSATSPASYENTGVEPSVADPNGVSLAGPSPPQFHTSTHHHRHHHQIAHHQQTTAADEFTFTRTTQWPFQFPMPTSSSLSIALSTSSSPVSTPSRSRHPSSDQHSMNELLNNAQQGGGGSLDTVMEEAVVAVTDTQAEGEERALKEAVMMEMDLGGLR
ncbi:hypothetical protein HDV05_004693 [Chytridiales sp. JEL 0842]|nr:hypothetical protein HDV05_004693 [Chytridiales sp. JEL 0842]